MAPGRLTVITGPSGVGKGTLVARLLAKHPSIWLSVSATTRAPRQGELPGQSYFFLNREQFELQVAAKPRDRELFVESSAVLAIDDTTATFHATLVVETLNAPLFNLLLTVPAEWQLTSVESGERGGVSPPRKRH